MPNSSVPEAAVQVLHAKVTGEAGQLLGGLWLGDVGPLGAELPNCARKHFLPPPALERQNSLETSVSPPSQLAFLRGQILSHPGCDWGLPKPTASLLLA